jgi:hypothetical protein
LAPASSFTEVIEEHLVCWLPPYHPVVLLEEKEVSVRPSDDGADDAPDKPDDEETP